MLFSKKLPKIVASNFLTGKTFSSDEATGVHVTKAVNSENQAQAEVLVISVFQSPHLAQSIITGDSVRLTS